MHAVKTTLCSRSRRLAETLAEKWGGHGHHVGNFFWNHFGLSFSERCVLLMIRVELMRDKSGVTNVLSTCDYKQYYTTVFCSLVPSPSPVYTRFTFTCDNCGSEHFETGKDATPTWRSTASTSRDVSKESHHVARSPVTFDPRANRAHGVRNLQEWSTQMWDKRHLMLFTMYIRDHQVSMIPAECR